MRSYLNYLPHCKQDEEREEWRTVHGELRAGATSSDLKSVIVHSGEDESGQRSRRLALWELAYRYELVMACIRVGRTDILRLESGTQRGG
jgi:hypothetical protein